MRILIVGMDTPNVPTGYAATCNMIGSGLIKKGHAVFTIAGNNHVNDQFVHNGIVVLPNKEDQYPSKELFLKYYNEIKPDVCLFHNDIYRFAYINKLDPIVRRRCLAWIPIEQRTVNDQLTLNALKDMEYSAVVSDYASEEFSKRLNKHIKTIYHQVDIEVFRPLDTKVALRDMNGFRDKFVVVRTDRNQPRKMWDLTLRAWQEFAKDKSDVILLAKTDPRDQVGEDLLKRVEELGIKDKVSFNPYFISNLQLNEIYNMSNLFFSSTGAEGFGLALAEACAAGLPVMATNVAPINEVLDYGKCGAMIGINGQVWCKQLSVNYDTIDVPHATQILNEFYKDWKSGGRELEKKGKHAREYVASRYDVAKIVSQFDETFKEMVEKAQTEPLVINNDDTAGKLLVGIVTHNRQDYLSCLLTSLLGQTYQNFDVHIIDNSDDESIIKNNLVMSLLKRLEVSGHVWKLWRGNPNLSFPICHQRILNTNSHNFIYKLDDDLILDGHCLERLMSTLRSDSNIAAAGGIFLDPNRSLDEQGLKDGLKPVITEIGDNVQWYVHKSKDIMMAEHLYSSYIYRRDNVKEIGGFPLNLSKLAFREDTSVTYALYKKGYKLAIVPTAIAWHFQNSPSGCHGIEWEKKVKMAQEDEGKFRQLLKTLGAAKK